MSVEQQHGTLAAMVQRPPAIAALVRVSSRAQATDSDSLINQRTALAAAGATRFFEYVGSGSKGDGAPRRASLQPVFDAIERGEISKLLVTDISRAARNGRVTDELIRCCDKHGVEFLAGGLQFSHEGSTQWYTARAMADMAELHSRQQSEKIRRGQQTALSRGLPVTGNMPWHLKRDPSDKHKAIPHPDRWDDARLAVTRYIAGEWSAQQVAEFIYPRHQMLRTTTSVLSWFRSHGIRGHHGQHRGPVLISNCYPALIDDDEAQALDRRIAKNRWGHGGKRKHVYSLSGICTCCHCGQRLVCVTTRNSVGKDYSYVRCNSPGCPAANQRVPHHQLEHWLQVRLASEAGRLFDARQQRTVEASPPGPELLNQRKRVAKLRALLAEFPGPGVETDLEQAVARLQQLEAPRATRADGGGWERFRAGTESWWAEASPTERNAELLAVIDRADADVTAWRRLPPEPTASSDPDGFDAHEEWEETCARMLLPTVVLRP